MSLKPKILNLTGNLQILEAEGGFTPPHIFIDDADLFDEIVEVLTGTKEGAPSQFCNLRPYSLYYFESILPDVDDVAHIGKVRITIEFFDQTENCNDNAEKRKSRA